MSVCLSATHKSIPPVKNMFPLQKNADQMIIAGGKFTKLEVSEPLAALSERTNIHHIETGAERHLGCGFGSIEYKSIHETGATTLGNNLNKWSGNIRKNFREIEKRENNDPAFGRSFIRTKLLRAPRR